MSAVGGILLATAGTLPVSPYITTISFAIYVVCRLIAWSRDRAVRPGVPDVEPTPCPRGTPNPDRTPRAHSGGAGDAMG